MSKPKGTGLGLHFQRAICKLKTGYLIHPQANPKNPNFIPNSPKFTSITTSVDAYKIKVSTDFSCTQNNKNIPQTPHKHLIHKPPIE
jgi:hypothetical protein